MKNGWIKISRNITSHWLWQDAERLKWWLDLLFMAAWEDRESMHDTHKFTLHRGQMIASVAFLAKRWDISNPTCLKFLQLLTESGMIKREKLHRQTSVLTICNYEMFQSQEVRKEAKTLDSIIGSNSDETLDSIVDSISNCTSNSYDTTKKQTLDSIVDSMVDSTLYRNIRNKEYKEDSSIESNQDLTRIDTDDFLKFFNAEMDKAGAIIPRLSTMTPQRERFLAARTREAGKEAVAEVVRKAAKSDFLNGRNGRGWTADFAWMMRPNNFAKILEGNYDNDRQKHALGRGRGETRAASAKDYEGSF